MGTPEANPPPSRIRPAEQKNKRKPGATKGVTQKERSRATRERREWLKDFVAQHPNLTSDSRASEVAKALGDELNRWGYNEPNYNKLKSDLGFARGYKGKSEPRLREFNIPPRLSSRTEIARMEEILTDPNANSDQILGRAPYPHIESEPDFPAETPTTKEKDQG